MFSGLKRVQAVLIITFSFQYLAGYNALETAHRCAADLQCHRMDTWARQGPTVLGTWQLDHAA